MCFCLFFQSILIESPPNQTLHPSFNHLLLAKQCVVKAVGQSTCPDCRAAGAKSASSQIKDVEVSRFIENHLCGKNSQTGRYLIGELEMQNSFGQSSLSQEGKGHYKQT